MFATTWYYLYFHFSLCWKGEVETNALRHMGMQALATHCISQAGTQRERHKPDPQDSMEGLERFFSLQIYNYTTQERTAYPPHFSSSNFF